MIHIEHGKKRASIIAPAEEFLEKSFLGRGHSASETLCSSDIFISPYPYDDKVTVDFSENTKFVRISVIASETGIDKIYFPKISKRFLYV